MLNAVSPGSGLTNVTQVAPGGRSWKGRGAAARPQPASATPAATSSANRSGILRRRPNPNGLAAAWGQDEMETGPGVDGALRNGDRQRVREPVGAGPVRVDFGDVFPPGREERERDVERAAFLVGDRTHVPALAVALPARDHDVVADLSREHAGGVPGHRYGADELERGALRVVLGQVRRHLERRVEDDVERQLLREGRPPPRVLGPPRPARTPLDQDVEDARGEVHRPGEQAREEENRLVLRWVPAVARPRVVFLAARALAAHHVGIRAALTSVVDRLVHVHHDPVAGAGARHPPRRPPPRIDWGASTPPCPVLPRTPLFRR